ncbi:hypothetical protein [Streptodolium elevatio]|uniref:Uncharacterized protein n=1 Tax=Streptodolium elevatio TaxID=3157996 RepID=A0ABV3DTJ9_9ACTN
MDVEAWMGLSGGAVAVASAAISFAQARSSRASAAHSDRQARAAEEQVRVAREQLEHAQRAHREANEPYVIVDIQQDRPGVPVLMLVVENIGPTVARNVRITATPPLESGWGDDLTQNLQDALARTIPMLPPGRRLTFLFDDEKRLDSGLPLVYNFVVQSEGPYGPVEDLEYTVDLGTWRGSLLGERATKKLEDKLGEIGTGLEELAGHYRRANADSIRAENDRTAERLRQRRTQRQAQETQAPAPDSTEP